MDKLISYGKTQLGGSAIEKLKINGHIHQYPKVPPLLKKIKKRRHDMKKKILSKCIYDHAEQFSQWQTSLKNQVGVPKKGLSQQITEKWQNDGYKWRQIRQKRDMI